MAITQKEKGLYAEYCTFFPRRRRRSPLLLRVCCWLCMCRNYFLITKMYIPPRPSTARHRPPHPYHPVTQSLNLPTYPKEQRTRITPLFSCSFCLSLPPTSGTSSRRQHRRQRKIHWQSRCRPPLLPLVSF